MATGDLSQAEIQNLQQTVASLEQRLATVESQISEESARQLCSIDRWRNEIVHITKELFPGDVAIELINDPEHPADWFHVVKAGAAGEPVDVVQRQIKWHQRTRDLAPKLRDLAISLTVRE